LAVAEPLLERNFHPTVIVRGYMRALQTALDTCNQISRTIDVNNTTEMREIVTSVRCFSLRRASWLFGLLIKHASEKCVASMVSLTRY
jgi:T-complex protein 1 subunit gamma